MLKLLIVDDEVKVCQLIEYLIDWKSFDIEIVGTANDGNTAYNKIIELHPDIVITDIRMPIYDGIDLIKMSQEISSDISFIIVSGHSHFNYAQQAIKYGVVNYLLKPIKKKELQQTIEKIVKKHQSKSTLENEHRKLKKSLLDSEKNNRFNFIREHVLEKSSEHYTLSEKKDFSKINENYSCHFQEGFFLVVIISPFLSTETDNTEIWNLLLTKISNIADEYLQENILEKISLIHRNRIIYFINTDTDSFLPFKKNLRSMTLDLNSLNEIFDNVRVIIGASSFSSEILHAGNLYSEAEKAVLDRFINRSSVIQYKPDLDAKWRSSFISGMQRHQLLSDFERLDIDQIITRIDQLFLSINSTDSTGSEIQTFFHELIECISYGVNTYMQAQEFPEADYFLEKMLTVLKLQDLQFWLYDLLRKTFTEFLENKKESQSKPIRKAKKYIHSFYDTNLNLNEISNELGFNPSYFSSLFKKETGKTFMEYVIDVRISYAKQYLVQTDLEIYEIAEKVSYSDVKYFSKLFKRQVKVTPLEYRKIYG